MKPILRQIALAWALALLAGTARAQSPSSPNEWQYQQRFELNASGLTRISLPVDTIDHARADLEDLRLYDALGKEIPFVVERPRPAPKLARFARNFQVALENNQTVVVIQTGLTEPLEAISLDSPAPEFIKAVTVSGSIDRKNWQTITAGQPIFRQRYGVCQFRINFPEPARWPFLRVEIDDRRTSPVPFISAQVHPAAPETVAFDEVPATITERHENPGETRLSLDLKAANLDVSTLRIETSDPLFMRQVTIAAPVMVDNAIREQTIAQGTIYRIALEERNRENLDVAVEHQAPSRELVLLIDNQDSPPLNIAQVRVRRRPVYLIFYAQQAGSYRLLSGNPRANPPKYDLAGLGLDLRRAPLRETTTSPLTDNPAYQTPEVLPGIGVDGAALDATAWRYRKPLKVTATGVQELELDLAVLARATPGFADLRILRGDVQVPFIVEHTSISRSLIPDATLTNVAKYPKVSRWLLKLPEAALPLNRLSCVSASSLFRRDFVLWEEAADGRGNSWRHDLGSTTWLRTPEQKATELYLNFQSRPLTDTLLLETDNGDNPAITLKGFKAFYPATRLLFKGKADEQLMLYYGNARSSAPSYDLRLVAGHLLGARKNEAVAGPEEPLGKTSWAGGQAGQGGIIFWGILALVVIVLLGLISRLLPKAPPVR